VNGFRYARDPVCWVACFLYGINRSLLPDSLKGDFLHGYFDDLLLIPAALPPYLWALRRLGLRMHDQFPGWDEIITNLAVWSVAAEIAAPLLWERATGDIWDVVAYSVGAAVSGLIWRNRFHFRRKPSQ
jgi:hypothetical protein